MTKFLTAIIITTVCLLFPGAPVVQAQAAPKPAHGSQITYSGGPGHSIKTAVVITGAPNSLAGIAAEYRYLKKNYGEENVDWLLRQQDVVQNGGKFYDRLQLDLKGCRRRATIFFDITEFFGKI